MVEYRTHFGFYGVEKEGKRPMRVWLCPEEGRYNPRTKKFDIIPGKECKECAKIRAVKTILKGYEADFITKGKDEKQAFKLARELPAAKPAVDFESTHNLSIKGFCNALSNDDKIGQLGIPKGTAKELRAAFAKHMADTQESAVAPSTGVWVKFEKSGKGFKTEYKQSFETVVQVVGKQKVAVPVQHVLSEEQIERLDAEGFDLKDLFLKPTCEQVARIVDSDYDPVIIDEINKTLWDAKIERERAAAEAKAAAEPKFVEGQGADNAFAEDSNADIPF
jgi:hypothetical protein